MKALLIEEFRKTPKITNVNDPTLPPGGVILEVKSTGICRSDWHGWMGHDDEIVLPHVPGHELVGEIVEKDSNVKNFNIGDRVTIPFVSGCGKCNECKEGHQQICDNQYQPGFSGWGSFAEYVALHYAENNLVTVPKNISSETASSLGCRFITAFRGIVDVAKIKSDEWVVIHGCGGVGLSGIMIAKAFNAKVIAVDINPEALSLAKGIGADFQILAGKGNLIESIKDITSGGAHISVDALGSQETFYNSISCLRKRGRHVQIGLLVGSDLNPKTPMHLVLANELQILGSHGMQSSRYAEIFKLIEQGRIDPEKLIEQTISIDDSAEFLTNMNAFNHHGVTVINSF